MAKAAGYLRVSTEGQAGEDRFGLADQRQAIESFAERQGLAIVAWYADEGISGATMERPELQRLLADASTRAFGVVLVAKMDRVARDLMAQLWIEKELLRYDAELVSASEPFRGQDPANVLFRQIIGAFAQFEKARITERMSGGRKQKARTGGYAGGGAPIGYRAARGSKALAVNEEKVATVRRAFSLAEQGLSCRQVAEALNREGHTTAGGAPFTHVQVSRILRRRTVYAGGYTYGGISAEKGQQAAILEG